MTVETLTLKNDTTREEAIQALALVEETYGRFGFHVEEGEYINEHLIELLLRKHDDIEAAERDSDNFRNCLWGIVAGGGVSASVTKKVYKFLGRENEATQDWI